MPKRNQIIQTPISTATSHSDEESMTEDVEKPFQPNSELSSSSIFRWCFSIKFCLSFLIAVFILFGVVIISAVWLGTLIPPNVVLSQDVRRADFNGIISKISRTLQEVELSTEAMKSQMNPLLDFNDFEKFELALYSAYKYDFQKTQGLVKTSHFGDNKGNGIGMTMIPSMGPILFNFTPAQAVVYFCNPDFDKYDHCKRNAAPDMVSSSGSTADFMNRCNAYPNLSSWFQSFVMETSVNFDTFVNFVTCFKLDVPDAKGNKFRQFFYKSLTVVSFSEYLHNMTMTISGSKSFIVELGTDYLLAIDKPDVKMTIKNTNGKVERKTAITVEDEKTNSVAKYIYTYLNNNLSSLTCNTHVTIESSTDYISMYRLCTASELNWLFVLSIPKWNYDKSIIIGVLVAIGCACIITVFGLTFSTVISLKIVKPFYNLMEQFEAVSNMDLNSVKVHSSKFYEVNQLQKHFLDMIGMIKQYRAFIPAHLLSQIEQHNSGAKYETTSTKQAAESKDELASRGQASHAAESSSTSDMNKSSLKRLSSKLSNVAKRNGSNMFSLFFEKKKITHMLIHMQGFSQILKQVENPTSCIEFLSQVFEQVNTVCRVSGGLIGGFSNDSLTISFNSSSDNAKHIEKAVQAGKSISEKLASKLKGTDTKKGQNSKLSNSQTSFRIAICSQDSICGNVGTNESKSFTIISNASRNLEAMIAVACHFDTGILVSETVHQTIQSLYHTRFVESIPNIPDDEYSSLEWTSSLAGNSSSLPWHFGDISSHKSSNIYEVGELSAHNADEWMYEMQEQEKKAIWKKYNMACKYMLTDHDLSQALSLLQEFSDEQHGTDKLALHHIEKCKQRIQ